MSYTFGLTIDKACLLVYFQIARVMLKNYLKTTFRNLLRNKVFSLINLLGLTIGISACLLILQYVQSELSYDQFLPQGKRLFRVVRLAGPANSHQAATSPALGPVLARTFPEVGSFSRIHHTKGIVKVPKGKTNTVFREQKIYFADANFLKVMGYPMRTKGAPDSFLKAPNTVVISQQTAARYFGGGNPVGETLELNDYNFGKKLLKVTGVFKDIPANSHLHFDMLFSLATIKKNALEWAKFNNWSWTDFYTFIQLKPGHTAKSLEVKFPPLVKSMLRKNGADPNLQLAYKLQNIRAIHLHSHLQNEAETNGNILVVRFLSILSLFILLLAWVNYINLSTARSLERAKEVGVRKVVGAHRFQLITQFLLEAVLLNLIALSLSLLVVDLVQPVFSEWSGQRIQANLWVDPNFVLLFGCIFLLGTIFSGAYPAFILSGFHPVKVLKGKFAHSHRGVLLRKSLVVIQFSISIILIIGTFTVYQQLDFMRTKDLGANLDQMLVVEGPALTDSTYLRKTQLFKKALLNYPTIDKVAYSSSIPSKSFNWESDGFHRTNSNTYDIQKGYRVTYIGQHFVETYQMDVLAGAIPVYPAPYFRGKGVVLNEMAYKQLGFTTPQQAVNQFIYDGNQQRIKILAVLKDYHHYSLKEQVIPTLMFFRPEGKYCSLKIKGQSSKTHPQTLAYVKQQFQTFFAGNPFTCFFVDRVFDQQYKADQQFGQIFALFAILAIFIACLGLFGLSLFTVQQKNKEIGIRKVLGASGYQVLYLLSQGFMKLILVAYLIGLPFTYWAIGEWLKNYAYKINIHLGLFLIPAFFVFILATLTIGFQTRKAMKTNPADILRYE